MSLQLALKAWNMHKLLCYLIKAWYYRASLTEKNRNSFSTIRLIYCSSHAARFKPKTWSSLRGFAMSSAGLEDEANPSSSWWRILDASMSWLIFMKFIWSYLSSAALDYTYPSSFENFKELCSPPPAFAPFYHCSPTPFPELMLLILKELPSDCR
jgi:hypothetical protein